MKKTPFFDRKYLGSIALGLAVAILAATAVIYIGFHMTSGSKQTVDIMYATAATVPRNVVCDGYILRSESVIEGVPSGALTPTVADGERVRVGNKVADIYSSSSAVTQAKIALVEDQIDFYEKCAASHISVGDTASSDKALSSAVLDIRRAVEDGNVSAALSIKTAAVLEMRRLGVLSGRVTDYASVIASLESTLASLKSSLGNVNSSVYAPVAGYYFSTVDGYEDIFSISDIDALTYSSFGDMVKAAEARETPEGPTLGKMVKDFRWYVACPMSSTDAAAMEIDSTYSVTLENNAGVPLDMQLCKVLGSGTDAVAVFCCSRIPDSYDFTRCQRATVAVSSFTGFRVPAEAVRIHDGLQGVFILDEVTVKFRRISIAYESGGYFYCDVVTDTEAELPEDISAETSAKDAESETPYYAYLRENDIVITAGTGLAVGMTLELK